LSAELTTTNTSSDCFFWRFCPLGTYKFVLSRDSRMENLFHWRLFHLSKVYLLKRKFTGPGKSCPPLIRAPIYRGYTVIFLKLRFLQIPLFIIFLEILIYMDFTMQEGH